MKKISQRHKHNIILYIPQTTNCRILFLLFVHFSFFDLVAGATAFPGCSACACQLNQMGIFVVCGKIMIMGRAALSGFMRANSSP